MVEPLRHLVREIMAAMVLVHLDFLAVAEAVLVQSVIMQQQLLVAQEETELHLLSLVHP
jgi:hypothetical protein